MTDLWRWWSRIRLMAALLFLLLAGLFSGGFCGRAAAFFHLQFGPSLVAAAGGALAVILGVLLLTLLFGRFYCSLFCPLGIFQEIFCLLRRKHQVSVKDLPVLRLLTAGGCFGLLGAGWSIGFLLLDPYSNWGRGMAGFTLGGGVFLILLAALALWKKRIFCVTFCPVGTILGGAASFSLFRLKIGDGCVQCGSCRKNCPTDCIDLKNRRIDNARCLRCLSCLAACPAGAIRFGRKEKFQFDGSRRRFLAGTGLFLLTAAGGFVLPKLLKKTFRRLVPSGKVLPPGAGSAERFARSCIGCLLCKAVCPEKIIVPAPGGIGPVRLDLSRGHCRYDCRHCLEVCPAGALPSLSLTRKRHIRIALAHLNPQHCLAFQEELLCGRCAKACPAGALKLRKNGTPRMVDLSKCIGCGACAEVCPARPRAITIESIPEQKELTT